MVCLGDACTQEQSTSHAFGCCTKYAKAFQGQDADGIVGLSEAPSTFIGDLLAHHNLKKQVFGICLVC